jgi:hypothetical protein
MSDCSHRLAASAAIRKLCDRSRIELLVLKRQQSDPRRASLLKLALSAVELHSKCLALGEVPRSEDERSEPLLVALTALETIARNEGV